MVCVLASVLGIGLSLIWGAVLNNTLAPAYGVESFYSLDAGALLTVFALALSLGTLAGLLPARRAMQVDPIDILREA
jgi:ABC-type antimicrobial peptide transport system permease subunit